MCPVIRFKLSLERSKFVKSHNLDRGEYNIAAAGPGVLLRDWALA